MSTEYVCAYVLRYAAGEDWRLLHRGSKEACDEVSDQVPAVAVSGPPPEQGAAIVVMPAGDWDEIWSLAGDA